MHEEKRFLLPSLSKITNVSLRIDTYDYENFYGHNDCKSDSDCADPNSICVNGACVLLCSYSDWIKNSKNCVFYHCDSKYLVTPNDYDSIFQKYKPIETNNFPILNRYLNGKKCSWVLLNTNYLNNSAIEKSFINLNFDRFSTRFASDFLYIFSGDSVYSPILAILSINFNGFIIR
ncbi:hypothetical protein BpHYR1_018700 [Brachionus plicatilis]|uniref:Uncharacterized protein n=1 Tax=Brachionus plicatilis TaxID=10195 RepID=A0A3M7Q2L2_BRAPC|nr:hypothetical protein BpHYR1_018700 [Brachionus plicatilis]